MTTLKIALLSDLHAFSPEKDLKSPSRLKMGAPESFPNQHPFAGLEELIKQGLSTDLLLCGGDMCDRANPSGAMYVWGKLEALKAKLGASHMIATAGNHDVDSRYQHTDFDAKGMLQSLRPKFPGLPEALCTAYWANNFAVYEEVDYRIVVLNSAAYHGAGKDAKAEFSHGRVSKYTVQAIKEALQGRERRKINILLCHHHPLDSNTLKLADYTKMDGGDILLDALPPLYLGPWIVIHGHKHAPNLMYSPGGASSPIIFSLGSFSAYLDPEYFTKDKNQFYVLEIEVPQTGGAELRGSVHAWDWVDMEGWTPADVRSSIPARAGFGYRAGLSSLAQLIHDEVARHGSFRTYEEIREAIPDIHYVLPKDIVELRHILKEVFKLNLVNVANSTNAFEQIVK